MEVRMVVEFVGAVDHVSENATGHPILGKKVSHAKSSIKGERTHVPDHGQVFNVEQGDYEQEDP